MKKCICLILIVVMVGMLWGCTPDPWERSQRWYCEEIDMTIEFTVDEDGDLVEAPYSRFSFQGQTYDVDVAFHVHAYAFGVDENQDGAFEALIDGRWEYRGKDLVFSIRTDKVFDGKYEELVFKPCD